MIFPAILAAIEGGLEIAGDLVQPIRVSTSSSVVESNESVVSSVVSTNREFPILDLSRRKMLMPPLSFRSCFDDSLGGHDQEHQGDQTTPRLVPVVRKARSISQGHLGAARSEHVPFPLQECLRGSRGVSRTSSNPPSGHLPALGNAAEIEGSRSSSS